MSKRRKVEPVTLKEMVYVDSPREALRSKELLGKGEYKGYKWYILSLGSHPVVYVEIPKDNYYYGKHYMKYKDLHVHGGITYSERSLHLPNETLFSWFIGWDYAHYLDYCSLLPLDEGKKWTTKEIYEEVLDVIDQIDRKNKKHWLINKLRSILQ